MVQVLWFYGAYYLDTSAVRCQQGKHQSRKLFLDLECAIVQWFFTLCSWQRTASPEMVAASALACEYASVLGTDLLHSSGSCLGVTGR